HLRLSPDDIWLTISQGVRQHINYNSEKFRHKFVRHEGQKEIFILVDDIISPSTLEVIKTEENVEKIELKELLECNFSTTTSSSLTASRIVLLDAVKKYFKYSIGLMCGIPKITLEGTLEDWMKLQEKIIHLRNLNLELNFWLDRLEPVICKLIETYRGEIDEEFWSKIVKINQSFGSGGEGPYITGWLTSFFPYDRTGQTIYNNLDISDIPNAWL
ncbi:15862_t:CDS:2, partial [Racocetra persica]